MADIADVLGTETGGVTYYDDSGDNGEPKVLMPEGEYYGHITSVETVERTVKEVHKALIYNMKVKLAPECADLKYDALDYETQKKVTVTGSQFVGREYRSGGVFKFLHPSNGEFEPNPSGNKGYMNFCQAVGKEAPVKEVELEGKKVKLRELPDLTANDLMGKPVIAIVRRGKPWVGNDGKTRTPLEVKWWRTWEDGEAIKVDTETDDGVPF